MSSALTVVKTSYTHTGQFIGNTYDPCFTQGKLNGVGDVYVSGNSFIFDYSNIKNSSDLKFLKQFFGGLTTGNTFGFTAGTYYNDSDGSVITWNGSFQLQGITGVYNEYIYCSGVCGTTSLTNGLYFGTNFTNPIQFSAITGKTAHIFVSSTPRKDPLNMEYLGIYGSNYGFEEYLEVLESTSNTGRLKIKNFIKLNNNKEIVYLENAVTNEDRFFNKSTVNLVQRGIPTLEVLATTQIQTGLIKVTDKTTNQNIIILNNQNAYQFDCRSQQDDNNYYYYYPNVTLKNFTESTEEITDYKNLSLIYSNVLKVEYAVQDYGSTSTDTIQNMRFLGMLQYEDQIFVDGNPTESVSLVGSRSSLPIKLDFSSGKNVGTIIEFYTDSDCKNLLTNNYYFLGNPGYEGCCFIYFSNRTNTPRTIYIKLQKNTTQVLELLL